MEVDMLFMSHKQIRNEVLLVLCLLLLLMFASSAYAKKVAGSPNTLSRASNSAQVFDYLKALPVGINQIVERCPWRSKQGKGVVRVIHTTNGLINELYLQWLLQASQSHPRKVISTIKVSELNLQSGYQFELPDSQLRKEMCVLSTQAIKVSTQRLHRVNLKLSHFGQYQISIHPILAETDHLKRKSARHSPSLYKD